MSLFDLIRYKVSNPYHPDDLHALPQDLHDRFMDESEIIHSAWMDEWYIHRSRPTSLEAVRESYRLLLIRLIMEYEE